MTEQKEAEVGGEQGAYPLEKWDDASGKELLKIEEGVKVLTFWLANEEYAIDISVIEEITKPIPVTYVPRVPPYINGIVNLRGRVIPILNVHVRLGLAPIVPGNKNRFIVCRTELAEVGILADRVNDVVHLEKYQLEPPPAKIAASGSGFIKNIGRTGGRILIVLNGDKLLRIDRQEI